MGRDLDRGSFAAGAEFAARTVEAVAGAWTGPDDVKAAVVDFAAKVAAAVRGVAGGVSWIQTTTRGEEQP